jgi:hypothetical protein
LSAIDTAIDTSIGLVVMTCRRGRRGGRRRGGTAAASSENLIDPLAADEEHFSGLGEVQPCEGAGELVGLDL